MKEQTQTKKIVFKYTSRSRPNNFFRGLNSIIDNCNLDNYEVLCTFDEDDTTMNNDFVKGVLSGYDFVKFYYGKSISKISAINNDLDKLPDDWDILVNMSDDMVFIQNGFDNIIRQNSIGNEDCLYHYPDGFVNERLITMSIMDKTYFYRFGYIYHPSYSSLFCDNEQMQVAKILGRYTYFNQHLFNHLHPAWGKAIYDAQYQHTEGFYQQDGEVFRQRQSINFGL